MKLGPVRLLYPQNASLFSVSGDDILYFRWKGREKGEVYRLRIAASSDPEKPVHDIVTASPGIALEKLPDGNYLWHVTASGEMGTYPYSRESNRQNFRVKTKIKVAPPVLIYPLAKRHASRLLLMNAKLLFAWIFKSPGAVYTWELSSDPKFAGTVAVRRVTSTQFAPKLTLPVGNYYWRVSSVLSGSSEPLVSEAREIKIIEHQAIRLDTPADGEILFQQPGEKPGRLLFAWQGSESGSYRLEVAGDRDFKRKIKSQELTANRFYIERIPPGNYFWRISLLDNQGGYLKRAAREFSVLSPPFSGRYSSPRKKTWKLICRRGTFSDLYGGEWLVPIITWFRFFQKGGGKKN